MSSDQTKPYWLEHRSGERNPDLALMARSVNMPLTPGQYQGDREVAMVCKATPEVKGALEVVVRGLNANPSTWLKPLTPTYECRQAEVVNNLRATLTCLRKLRDQMEFSLLQAQWMEALGDNIRDMERELDRLG